MFGRALLGIGYLAVPFAGPGASVLTAAGWLVTGNEERQQYWALVGLIGLVGVAGVLAAHYGSLPNLDGVGGVLLLIYEALAIVALWNAATYYNSLVLKAAAILYASGLLLAFSGASTATVASWGSLEWAGEAAKTAIEVLGGPLNLSRGLAAAGGILAAIGFLAAPAGSQRGEEAEIFEALAKTV
ncbi:MAG TPA: hypothetical protein EYP08_01780 [Pyrodictiaceae archaeon]|nr:hypothetical protein [Pyrodictiaceae archaeon]HIP85541.1 hypothetical protein [Pyrodictium sp.]HIQ55691.1 hypothetical protein [Pyrodictium sp.]